MATSDASPASPQSPRAQEVPQSDALQTEAETLFKDEMSTLEHEYRTTLLELFYWRRDHSQSEPMSPIADLTSMDWEQLNQSQDFTAFAAAHPLQATSGDEDTAIKTTVPKTEVLDTVSTPDKTDQTLKPIPPLVSKVIQSMPVARYRERPAHVKKTKIIPYGKRAKSRHHRKQAIQRTLELYAWQYKVQQQPLFKALPSARKFVPTSHWKVARDELKSFRALQRVEVLKNQNQWAFRQLEKHEAPTRTKTHWDYLLDEMQWLQADFKEERRWKIAMAYQVGQWVMEWHQSTDKAALCVKSSIPSLQASYTLVKPADQLSETRIKPPTTPAGDPLNRENWLQCLDPNSGLVLDDQLSQEILAHYYEYPLFVPPIYDEQAQYEDLLEHGQTVPISALMSTMVAFDQHQPPTNTWTDQTLQTVPQKRTADSLDEYLAILDKESAALAGDSEQLTLTGKPLEAQDMLDHPNDYCLADNEYTTFSTSMFDGGYPGDHTIHQPTKTARPLPGSQVYHSQHVLSPLFAHQRSQDGHGLPPALTAQTGPPEIPATVGAAMWTSEEEALLQELVDQYGPYWNLVSDALNASDHIPGSVPRNARDCYDRWNLINLALTRPADRGLIPSTPLSATSTLVAGEHGQTAPETQTVGADEKRGQRLQSFTDAIKKTSKRRQETQQRMQQTLATRSKKLGSFMMASAPDANGTESNAEPGKSTTTPGEAGSDATKPAADDKGVSSMATPQVPYRSPLELGVAKQELDAQMAQLALRRQRSFNTTQWTMHNLARSMMGRPMGIPMVNRPMMPPGGLTPVRPGMGMSLPPGALPTAAAVPASVPSGAPVDSNPMATATLGNNNGGTSVPPTGAAPSGPALRNHPGVNPAVARGLPQLAGIPANLAARLTPEQLHMVMLTRQAQLMRQAAALQAAQGGTPTMQATAPNTSGPLGQQQPGLAMSLPGMMSSSPGLPTSSLPAPTSTSLQPNAPSSPMTSPTTGAATAAMVSPSRGGVSPKPSVAKTPRSVASPLSNKKSLGSPLTPTSTHAPRKQTSIEPKSPDTPQKLALQSPTPGLKTMGNPAELVASLPATAGASSSLSNVPQNPANLSMLAAQLANLTPVQKLKLLRQHQHYQQLLQQAHASEGFKQQIQQAQQQTQAQLRQHLQRAQLLQQQQQRAGQSGGANSASGADSSGNSAPGVESGTKPQDRPGSTHGSPNPAGSSSNTRTFPATSRALGLSLPNMASGSGMGNLGGISSAEFLAAFEKHKQQHPGFNADKLRMQMLQQHLAMTAQAHAQSQQANAGGTSLLNTASPGMTAANTLVNNNRPPNPQSPVMTAQSATMTASPRHAMRPMVNPMGMMSNTPGGPRMRPPTTMMGSPPLVGNAGGQHNLMNNPNFAPVGLPANSLGLAASGMHGLPHHQFMMAHQPSPHGHLHGSPGVSGLPHTPPTRPANLPNVGGSPSHHHQSLAQTAYMANPNVNAMPPGNNPALALGTVGVGRPNTAPGGATPNLSALQAALFANNPAAVQNMMQALANAQRTNAMGGAPNTLPTGMNPNVMAAMAAAAQSNAGSGSGGSNKTTSVAPNVANLGTPSDASATPPAAANPFANPHFSPRPQSVVSGVSTPVGSAGPSPNQPPHSLPATSAVSSATMSHSLATAADSSPKADPKPPTQTTASPDKDLPVQPTDTAKATQESDKPEGTSSHPSTAGD